MPVAKPAPKGRWRLSRGPLLVGAGLAAVVLGLVLVVAFAWPAVLDVSPTVVAGQVDEFAVGEPVHFEEEGFFVVKLASGEVIALSDRAGGHLKDHIEWQPSLEFEDQTGWFRAPSHRETYSLDGSLAFGPASRGMDRFPVEVSGDTVRVDTSRLICGPGAPEGMVCVP